MTTTSTPTVLARARRGTVVALVASAMLLAAPGTQADAAPKKPGKVATVKASVKGTSVIKVRWSKAKDATRYKIEVATDRTMTRGRKAAVLKGRVKTVTGLSQGTTYYVRVRAYRGKKVSAWSKRVTKRTLFATPGTPTVRAQGHSRTTASIRWNTTPYATRYRVIVTRGTSTAAVVQRSRWVAGGAAEVGGLNGLPAGESYYARVEADNSARASRLSAPTRIPLLPYTPTGIGVAETSPIGLTARWNPASNANRYQVQLSPTAAFGAGTRTVTVPIANEGRAAVNGLLSGTRGYVRVRSLSGSLVSPWSGVATGVARPRGFQLDVGSYNVHCANPSPRCSTAHPWFGRKKAVADLLNEADYDVVGLQELSTADVDGNLGNGKQSQAGDLEPLLDTSYAYASGKAHQSGRWLLYNTDRIEPVGEGDSFSVGYSTGTRKDAYAVWQVFRHKATGQRFVVANAHLDSYIGRTYDDNRFTQTRRLINTVQALPQSQGLPIVWTGDFNSHELRQFDGPRAAFAQVGILDGDDGAATKIRADFNSANGWRNPNPRSGAHTDHVYVRPSIGVSQFEVDLDVDDAGRWLGQIPSDHNAVRTRLSIPY